MDILARRLMKIAAELEDSVIGGSLDGGNLGDEVIELLKPVRRISNLGRWAWLLQRVNELDGYIKEIKRRVRGNGVGKYRFQFERGGIKKLGSWISEVEEKISDEKNWPELGMASDELVLRQLEYCREALEDVESALAILAPKKPRKQKLEKPKPAGEGDDEDEVDDEAYLRFQERYMDALHGGSSDPWADANYGDDADYRPGRHRRNRGPAFYDDYDY